jgi:hypothetical protein
MYFPDLSRYAYWGREPNTYNVGWLDATHPYPTGDVPTEAVERLHAFLEIPVRPMLGAHRCELCHNTSWGNEIRIFGQGEIVYAAPTMIYHYVVDHHYRPPDEFIQAILTSPAVDSVEYRERARAYLWGESIEAYYEWLDRNSKD